MAKDKKTEAKKVEKKDIKKNTKKKGNTKKEGLIKGIKKEVKLIKWPEKKDVLKYTISTLIFCLIVALFFVLLTYLLSIVKGV